MKALHILKYGRIPQLVDLPKQQLKQNQLLIKMKYAPINPSDINFFQGFYGIKKAGFPIPGFQGSGIIQQFYSKQHQYLLGSRVSVVANMQNGTFATHMICNPQQLIIWPDNLKQTKQELQNISMQWINPVSCIGMWNIIQTQQAKVVVLSAATSQLNKMIIKYIKKKSPQTTIIGFSRNNQYDEELKKLGIDFLFRMDLTTQTVSFLKSQKKTVFLDCVGGQFAGNLFNSLSLNSVMVNYGRLSKEHLQGVDLGELYFSNKKIRGFWMSTYLKQINQAQLKEVKEQIIQNHQIFVQSIRKTYKLQEYQQAFRDSIKNTSQGKILFQLNP